MAVEAPFVNFNVKLVVIRRRRVSADIRDHLLFLAQKVCFSDYTCCPFIYRDQHLSEISYSQFNLSICR